MQWPPVSVKSLITAGFAQINKRLDSIVMSQDAINSAVQTFGNLLTDLTTDNQEILTDLQTLVNSANSGTPVDVTALTALAGRVAAVQNGLDAAVGNLNTLAAPPASPAAPTA
jgi:hypothetical protein